MEMCVQSYTIHIISNFTYYNILLHLK